MKNFLVLFREPDGRMEPHSDDEIRKHQEKWRNWLAKWRQEERIAGGSGLSLQGNMIRDNEIIPEIHKVGKEIIGGFLLVRAIDLNEATAIAKSCPIYEFGGYAEIREMQ